MRTVEDLEPAWTRSTTRWIPIKRRTARGKISSINVARYIVETNDGGHAVTDELNSTIWLVKFAQEPNALPDNTSPPPDHVSPQFPTSLILAVIIIVIVGIGLLVYFKKCKFGLFLNSVLTISLNTYLLSIKKDLIHTNVFKTAELTKFLLTNMQLNSVRYNIEGR